jgi:hypothetical protein
MNPTRIGDGSDPPWPPAIATQNILADLTKSTIFFPLFFVVLWAQEVAPAGPDTASLHDGQPRCLPWLFPCPDQLLASGT